MAYVKTDWQTGDVITADLLNHMEQGIADYQVGPKGDTGLGVKAIALTTDAAGAVTGGTVTFTNDTTAAITVTTAGA